jgi:ubiquinone/menaquinone biosynthesis C-methylase UbiE
LPAQSREQARQPQLAYSELQQLTHDEAKRRTKAAKIRAVLQHFLGTDDLSGLTVVDIGCSTGYTAEGLSEAGARVLGFDIDVPGLTHAVQRVGNRVGFACADGSALPLPDKSVDVVVFNHIYEHVVDPSAVMAEIRRVLREDGIAYLGFANRLGIMEPHYRLPFLSWLPPRLADRYVSATKRAPHYYERLRTRPSLKKMAAGLHVWDYTYTLLRNPDAFEANDIVPARLRGMPTAGWHALAPIMPTFIWIGTPGDSRPRGPMLEPSPKLLANRGKLPA